jgi:DNA-binding transcriptional ArsR family regulator
VFPRDANGLDLNTLVGPVATVEEGLDRLLGTPLAQLRCELEWYNKRHHLTAWSKSLADSDAGPRRDLADAIAALHDVAVRPYWAQIDTQLRTDRAARVRTIADSGLEHLLATVCPSHVRWRQPTLQVDTPLGCDADVHLDGRGLILIPSIFVGHFPYLAFNLADPTAPATLIYPAINDLVTAQQLWTADRPVGQLAALLGRTRSAILEAITDGCGTVELARRLGISAASVSQHTAVLRNSGLISTRRDGPSVIHVVTSLGSMLLDPARSTQDDP